MPKLAPVLSALVVLAIASAQPAHAEERLRYFGGEVPAGMRVKHERDQTLIVGGLVGFAVSWGLPATIAFSASPKDDDAKVLLVPVAGPIIGLVAMANARTDSLAAEAGKTLALVFATPLFVFDALAQAGSLLAIGLGAAGIGGKDYLVPNEPQLYLGAHRLRVAPSLSPKGGGVSVAATF